MSKDKITVDASGQNVGRTLIRRHVMEYWIVVDIEDSKSFLFDDYVKADAKFKRHLKRYSNEEDLPHVYIIHFDPYADDPSVPVQVIKGLDYDDYK